MTIKQQGGVFGRHPTFSSADIDGPLTADSLATSGAATIGGALSAASLATSGAATIGGALSATSARFPAGTYPAQADAADLVIGSTSGNNGITIVSSATGIGSINFGDNGNIDAGQIKYDHGTTAMAIIVERQTRGVFNANGLAFPSGNGIDFSATAGTGTSELFDDYEEGTWTPTLYGSGGGSATIGTVNLATYTKVGNVVHLVAYLGGIDLSAHTISGNVRLGGIPFNAVQYSGVAAATFCNMFTFDEKTTGVSAYASTNHFQLMQGSSAALITATELGTSATAVIMFSATYTAS